MKTTDLNVPTISNKKKPVKILFLVGILKATEEKSIRIRNPVERICIKTYPNCCRPESVVDDDLPPHVKTLGHLWRVELLVAPAQVQLTGCLHHFSYEGL